MRAALPFLVTAVTMACSPGGPPPGTPHAASGGLTHETLAAFFASEWDYAMREDPTYASNLGDHRFDDRWPDVSPAANERRAAHAREILARLHAMDPRGLSAEDRLSFAIFLRGTESDVEGQTFRLDHLAIDQNGGIQSADDIAAALPFATTHDYDAWIARLRALPAYVDQTAELLREGIKEHIVHPREAMERVSAQIAEQLVDAPEKSPFYAPLQHFSASVPAADRERLTREAHAAIADGVIPAYRRFGVFFDARIPARLLAPRRCMAAPARRRGLRLSRR